MAYQQPYSFKEGSHAQQPRPLLPSQLASTFRAWVRAGVGGVLLLVTVAAWLSLLSWSLHDPSLSHTTALAPRNWLGAAGAMGADLILQTFGVAALLLLLAPMFWGLTLVQREPVPRLGRRVSSYFLAVLALAAAASALPAPASWPLYHGLGGIIGDAAFRIASAPFAVFHPELGRLAAGLMFALAAWWAAHSIGATRASLAPVPFTLGKSGKSKRAGDRAVTARVKTQAIDPNSRLEPVLTVPPQHLAPIAQAQPDPRTQVKFGPYAAFDFEAGEEADPEFDAWTEQATSGIAARFAPQDAAPPANAPRALQEAVVDAFTGGRPAPRPAQEAPTEAQPYDVLPQATVRTRPHTHAYKRPSLNLLERAGSTTAKPSIAASLLRGNARLLEDSLAEFGVVGQVRDITPGPVVTLYELEPARGTNVARVIALAGDIARHMGVPSVRIAALHNTYLLGIEMPNPVRELITLRDVLGADSYRATMDTLPIALGRSITGEPVVADLAQLPSLLVSGANGSGKSTGINAMILSLLYKHGPDDCRFLMIDEKMLDLAVYNGIPHLLTPVISDPHKALTALAWCVSEMEERVKRMASLGVRNIDLFNNRVRNAKKRGERLARTVQTGFDDRTGEATYVKEDMNLEPMPYIVIVIDEFAGLMAMAGKEIEGAVQRLAQAARSCGIHLILATERPSSDIVTTALKASVPARVSYKSATKIDSRAVIGSEGAEQLLGSGDLLFASGPGAPMRVHGPYVSGAEIEGITGDLRQHNAPRYVEGLTGQAFEDLERSVRSNTTPATVRTAPVMTAASADALYDRAVAIVVRDGSASREHLQRRLTISPSWAAGLLQRLENDGVVGQADSRGQHPVLVGAAA